MFLWNKNDFGYLKKVKNFVEIKIFLQYPHH